MTFYIEPFNTYNIPYAVRLGEELHGLGSLNHIPFNHKISLDNTKQAATNPNWCCRIAVTDEDSYVGFVAGYVTPFLFSDALLALEVGWYVRQGTKDRTKIAVKLMRNFISWALDDKKAVQVQTGDIANINSLAVDSLYRHIGFKRYGTIYQFTRD